MYQTPTKEKIMAKPQKRIRINTSRAFLREANKE
jgi:hypothetical protein